MHALPVDLIIEILCRLPVKSLLRFRCLSKQFRSIIDSPDFINRHLQYHFLEQRLIVGGACPKLLLLDLDSVDNAFKIELPFENWGHGFVHVIGSCDGLLALFHAIHNRNSIVLWNISTKKHQILPNCLSDFNERFNEFHRFGFGRDAATHDYKLVKMVNFFKTNVTEVSVYSLKANCWRRIDGFPRYSTYYLHDDMAAALVEGTLNWGGELVDAEERRKDFIVSFDLKNEIFFEVSLPDVNQEIEESAFTVMVLGGCLCLIYHYPHQLDKWVMKEYRVKDSWTKLYWLYPLTVLEFPPITKAFVYSKHGDKLFIFPNYGEVFQHDLKERI